MKRVGEVGNSLSIQNICYYFPTCSAFSMSQSLNKGIPLLARGMIDIHCFYSNFNFIFVEKVGHLTPNEKR